MFAVRRLSARRRWAIAMIIVLSLSGVSPCSRQQRCMRRPRRSGHGFVINGEDVRFIFHQIDVAQAHAAGGTLLGPGPNQVQAIRSSRAACGRWTDRTTTSCPVPDQHLFGSADRLFPRLTTPVFRDAQPFGSPPAPTSYKQKSGTVVDADPRIITNLIVDQSAANPAAAAAAANPCGSGGFVCSNPEPPDPDTGALFIPNITPDFGLSAPFNLMFAFFGQFFDHGLDLVTKGGGTVIIPLQPDDPLFAAGIGQPDTRTSWS